MGLYRRVRLLEHELVPELMNEEGTQPLSLSIATNADSLATWLLPALSDVMNSRQVELNLAIHGESRTIEKIKSGEVAGAISLEPQPIPGCSADYLGRMDYVCVANPSFHQRYFSDGVNYSTLTKAPVAIRERGIKRDLSSDIKLCPQPLTSVSCWFLQRQSCVRSPVAGLVM